MSGRLALLLAVAAAGCQDREVVGAVFVKSVLVMAASGGTITITAEEDPVLAGVSLQIVPGSLPRDLTVTIERGGQDIAGSTTLPAGPVVIVGPVGTQLRERGTLLGLPVTQGTTSDRLFIEVGDSNGRRALVASVPIPGSDARSARTYIDRFTAFQAARLRPGVAAPDAGVPPVPPLPPPPPPPVPRDAR